MERLPLNIKNFGERPLVVQVALVSFGFFDLAYVGSRKPVVSLTVKYLLDRPLHNVLWRDNL